MINIIFYCIIDQKMIIEKFMYALTILLLTLMVTCKKDDVSIIFVSSTENSADRPVYSSLRGGTKIRIKAVGHELDERLNQVLVGTFPCIIPSGGVTNAFITCETSDSKSTTDIYNLKVTLISDGRTAVSSSPDLVHYTVAATPKITEVFPSSTYGGSTVAVQGNHNTNSIGDKKDTGDMDKLELGDKQCSLEGVTQDKYSPGNGNSFIKCRETDEKEAGEYKISQKVDKGEADHDQNLQRASLDGRSYEYTYLPTVREISDHQGDEGGQVITIKGSGFSKRPENNTVTVDGNPCEIIQVDYTKIKCRLAPRNHSLSSLLPCNDSSHSSNNYTNSSSTNSSNSTSNSTYSNYTNSSNISSQQNGYHAGTGVNYQRHQSIYSLQGYIASVRAGTIGAASQSAIKTQLREPALYNYASAQNWRGYFVAPTSGLFVFRGVAGGRFSMYLAQVSGTTKLKNSPFIYSDIQMTSWDNFYYDDAETAERNVSLVEGQSYYFEIYHQFYYPAFFKLIVDVPNTNTKLKYQSYQVQRLVLNATVEPEQILYSMIGANKGYLNLRITRYNTKGEKIYNVNTTIAYNCSENQFLNAIRSFDNFASYMPSVVKEYYDSDDNQITANLSSAYKINYIVSLFFNRSSILQRQNFIVSKLNYTGSFSRTILRQHSPLISGTYSISIGGWNLQKKGINFDVSASTLQSYIRQIPGFQKVQVVQTTQYGCSYWCTWIINYKEVFKPIPPMQIDNSDITGGAGDAAITLRIRRPYSSRITFEPIDHQFLRRPNPAPSVIVESNNLTSVCLGNCSYIFRNISTIISYTFNSPNLQVTLDNGFNQSISLKNITITLGGLPCTVEENSTLPTIRCSLKKDSYGFAPLKCGYAKLEVFIVPFGFMKLKNGLTDIFIPLAVHYLQSLQGGINGGTINSIIGSGFTEDIDQIQIQICNSSATVISSTLYMISFYMPSCPLGGGNKTIFLKIGNYFNTLLDYKYITPLTPPAIHSVHPFSSNPAIKGALQIWGTGFGQNISEIQVFLANATGKIYRLKVLTLNNTYIKVGLSGGLPGVYTVEVSFSHSVGNSVPVINGSNIFEYKLQVVSVYPKVGSFFGGTLITITGVNFSPAQGETHVYVGPALNWFCSIISITNDTIKCRTPMINSNYEVNNSLSVVISTKIYMLSKCSTNDCYFSYMDMISSPTLTNISSNSISQNYLLSLSGSNFLINSNGTTVVMTNILNESLVFTLSTFNTTNSSTSFYVTLSVPGGDYLVKVRTSIGDSNPLLLKVDWIIGNPNVTTGSTEGFFVNITGGGGYPSSLSTSTYLTLSSPNYERYYELKVISCCVNNNLIVELPPQPSGTVMVLSFKSVNFTKNLYFYTSSSTTPNLNLTTSKMMNQGINAIKVERTDSIKNYIISEIVLVSTSNSQQIVTILNLTSTNFTYYNFSASLASGSYLIRAKTSIGYCTVNSSIYVNLSANISLPYQQFSYAGGEIKLIAPLLSPSSYLLVGGIKAKIKEYTSSYAVYSVPPLVSNFSQNKYRLISKPKKIDPKYFTIFGESSSTNASAAFDDSTRTIYGSGAAICYVGVDVGFGLSIVLDMVRFFPMIDWVSAYNYLESAVFQTSQNGLNWTLLYSIDQNVHTGWNAFRLASQTGSRYLRFRHTSKSHCNLAEIELYGYINSELNFSTVGYYDGWNSQIFTNAIEPRDDRTPVVRKVQPSYGDIFGGYVIRLSGENLNFSTASIMIDQVACVVLSSNNSYLECQVGASLALPKQHTFIVKIGTLNAVIHAKFVYVLKWSDQRTWGVDMPPIDGDLVYIPPGLTLLVDQNTPDLIGITVVNGTIIIPNNTDISIRAGFLTIIGGNFMAGSQEQPFYGNLQITLTGGYYGKQQPLFGNKVFGCLDCHLSLYGRPRLTWTTLAMTIASGDSFLKLSEPNDWTVGQEIVVSSTSFNHKQSQRRKIVNVTNGTIFVDSPFLYTHLSEVKYFSNDSFTISAQVGLLTRNIKVRGDQETLITDYGAHLLVSATSPGALQAIIAYTEFTRCGQQKIPGRNCLRFTNTKEVPSSVVRGNSIYDSYSRLISLNDVSFLTVEKNVGYRVKGHNIFFESGTESNNNIRNNLLISSLRADGMLQSDFTVSSIWISNPDNNIEDNHLAGGDYYGIFYKLQDKTTGASDICPSGTSLGKSSGNYIHSFAQQGLRITKLIPRKFPCTNPRNQYNSDDQWLFNPSIPTIFSNYVLYRNGNEGVLIQQVGNLIFDGFQVADNAISGINIQVANFTKEMVGVRNSLIIGQLSSLPAPSATARGILTPRTGLSNLSNVRFYNFSTTSLALATCSGCDSGTYMTNLGNQVYIEKIKFDYIQGGIISMLGVKRDVIVDLDASLSSYFFNTSITAGTLVWGFNHIANRHPQSCHSAVNSSKWDGIIMCDSSITIRRIFFTNAIGSSYYWSFYYVNMNVLPIDSVDQIKNASNTNNNLITTIGSTFPQIQKPSSWSLPYVTGQIYQVTWGASDDFSHISISTAPNYGLTDLGVVFKMPYKLNRELYSVGPMRGYTFPTTSQLVQQSISNPNPTNCSNGDYRHVNDQGPSRMIAICQSGKNKAKYEYTEVNAIFCKYVCPTPPVPFVPSSAGTIIRENFVRRWSNASQWPNGTIPGPGENVFVNGNWTVLIDMDPHPANFMLIDGTLIVDDSRDIRFPARAIHIRAGNVSIGSANNPFNHKFTIELLGSQSDPPMQFNSDLSGSKMLVVSGILNLFGTPPYVPFSYLGDSAMKGQKLINVASNMGWNAGDKLGLSPSFGKYNEFQEVTIAAINLDSTINITEPLSYTHYGSSQTLNTVHGQIDLNTYVSHLSRNIQIISGNSSNSGSSVVIYGYYDMQAHRIGVAQFYGVEIIGGGQREGWAGLQFLNLMGGSSSSSISYSSIHSCKGVCVGSFNSISISFSSNNIFNGLSSGISLSNTRQSLFSNNLIIGLASGACLEVADSVRDEYGLKAKDNFCLGSANIGYDLPLIGCQSFEGNYFGNNTAGSCRLGYLLRGIDTSDKCQGFSYLKAYACNIGQSASPMYTSQLIYQHFILIDNVRGASLRFGDDDDRTEHIGRLQYSFISALSRPSCSYCYGSNATRCSSLLGLQMLSVSGNGQDETSSNVQIINTAEVFDSKAYLQDVIFQNYRSNFTAFPQCGNSFVLRPHPQAYDAIAIHSLFDCQCVGCDSDSYILADAPDQSLIGWQNGCGGMVCTGRSNYLVVDFNGTFLTQKGLILPSNQIVGQNQDHCTYSARMNAHICLRSDLAVLAYQSVANDYNSREVWPVSLSYDGSNYTTITNAWRQWEWQGKTPRNRRLGRFLSIVKLEVVYNITFKAMPPIKLQFQLQQKEPQPTGNGSLVMKIHYPLPNMIRILGNGKIMNPIPITDNGTQRQLNLSICGDNVYYYANYTSHFVITQKNCKVKLQLVDSVQLTTHFIMKPEEFFQNTVMSSYINNLCALLSITDTSRVKIVGVYQASTIVQAIILPSGSFDNSTNSTNTSTSANSTAQALQMAAIQQQVNLLIQNGTYADSMQSVVGYIVVNSFSTLSLVDPTNSQPETVDTKRVGIFIGVGVGVSVIVIIILVICFNKKAANPPVELQGSEDMKDEIKMAAVPNDSIIFSNESQATKEPKNKITNNMRKNRRRANRNNNGLEVKQNNPISHEQFNYQF